jgi:hypothetical protein
MQEMAMGANPRKYMNMTPEQSRKAMRNIMRLHLGLAISGMFGMAFLAGAVAVMALVSVLT